RGPLLGALEDAPHGMRQPQHEVGRDGRLAHGAADAVRAEIGPAHALSFPVSWLAARHTCSAATVSLASLTRTMRAPPSTASSAAATLGTSGSPATSPVACPSEDLRDQPTSSG